MKTKSDYFFLVVCFAYLAVSRSFPAIKKDEVVRVDLLLPNSNSSDTLTARNQSERTSSSGKWKWMNTLFDASFFSWYLDFKSTYFPTNAASQNRINSCLALFFNQFSGVFPKLENLIAVLLTFPTH